MSWVLLLIQLIPAVIKLIQIIRELIGKLPRHERTKARLEMVALCKRQVRQAMSDEKHAMHMEGERYVLAADEGTAVAALEGMIGALRARTSSRVPC